PLPGADRPPGGRPGGVAEVNEVVRFPERDRLPADGKPVPFAFPGPRALEAPATKVPRLERDPPRPPTRLVGWVGFLEQAARGSLGQPSPPPWRTLSHRGGGGSGQFGARR